MDINKREIHNQREKCSVSSVMNRVRIILLTVLYLFGAMVGFAQSTLLIDEGTNYPLIGKGEKQNNTDHHNDIIYNVDALLDEYYSKDVETEDLGKIEAGSTDSLNSWDIVVYDDKGDEVDFGKDKKGTYTITVESTDHAWSGPIWFSVKAGKEFRLYDSGINSIIPPDSGSTTYTVKWKSGKGLSHISFWTEEKGVSEIPEPAAMLLFGVGLTGLASLRKRRKKQ